MRWSRGDLVLETLSGSESHRRRSEGQCDLGWDHVRVIVSLLCSVARRL
jgi:hypothetical protein